ncbi:PH domain-containing protein [Vibrio sp. IB15]|uniref:PH domain-containing protein n=1 Tax=Vibrio sp. IB15 TaxID=2779368 RepID=UPI0018E7DE83|nr:PH domain-containing protein [Vibrio sp. IB15]MBJ2146064.1 PH domain-containing protein [Vibrio sp. IB15]
MNSFDRIEVAKLPCAIEEIVDIFFQLVGLAIVYWLFTAIGEFLIGEDFSTDVLLSMVVLPAILVLKQSSEILQPYFVKVSVKGDKLSVTQGILTVFEDSLSLDNVENVETITTLFGRFLGYSTFKIYAFGAWVIVPNVKNPQKVKKHLEDIINSKKA